MRAVLQQCRHAPSLRALCSIEISCLRIRPSTSFAVSTSSLLCCSASVHTYLNHPAGGTDPLGPGAALGLLGRPFHRTFFCMRPARSLKSLAPQHVAVAVVVVRSGQFGPGTHALYPLGGPVHDGLNLFLHGLNLFLHALFPLGGPVHDGLNLFLPRVHVLRAHLVAKHRAHLLVHLPRRRLELLPPARVLRPQFAEVPAPKRRHSHREREREHGPRRRIARPPCGGTKRRHLRAWARWQRGARRDSPTYALACTSSFSFSAVASRTTWRKSSKCSSTPPARARRT